MYCMICFLGKLQQSSKGPQHLPSSLQVLTIGGLSTGTQAMAIKKGCHMVIAAQQKSWDVSLKIEGKKWGPKFLIYAFPYL